MHNLISRPQRAAYIQHLALEGELTWPTAQDIEIHRVIVAEEDLIAFIGLVKGMKVRFEKIWIHGLRLGNMEALLALLVSQLTNLKTFTLNFPNNYPIPLLGAMFREVRYEGWRATHPQPETTYTERFLPTFGNLQEVSIKRTWWLTWGKDSIDPVWNEPVQWDFSLRNAADILPFFYLPAIQHISATIDNPLSFVWPMKSPLVASTLISLDIEVLREGHLREILRTTTRLKKLRWCWLYAQEIDDGQFVTSVIDLDRIAEALISIRDTLTDLAIEAEAQSLQAEWVPLTITGSLQALANFDKMERLELPQCFLYGGFTSTEAKPIAHLLPRNIQYLAITDELWDNENYQWDLKEEHLEESITMWLSDWRTSTPNLRTFHLRSHDCRSVNDRWSVEIYLNLRMMCKSVGVEMEITRAYEDGLGWFND